MDPVIPAEEIVPGAEPVVPQPEQVDDPGYTNADLRKDSIREIVTNTDEPVVPPAAESPAPTGDEDPEPPLDEVGKKIAEDAVQAVLDRQAEEARIAKETEEKAKEPTAKEKQYIDWEEKFNKDNNRAPSYLEALAFVEEQAILGIQERQKQADETKKVEAEKVAKAAEEETKRINAFVDDEMADLYASGKLTKIQDPNNPSDQGVVERRELFKAWQEVNTKRRAEGKPEIISPTRIYEFYYTKPSAQVAGADAPVAGSRGTTTPPGATQEINYQRDIKGKPFRFFGQNR